MNGLAIWTLPPAWPDSRTCLLIYRWTLNGSECCWMNASAETLVDAASGDACGLTACLAASRVRVTFMAGGRDESMQAKTPKCSQKQSSVQSNPPKSGGPEVPHAASVGIIFACMLSAIGCIFDHPSCRPPIRSAHSPAPPSSAVRSLLDLSPYPISSPLFSLLSSQNLAT